MVKKINKEIVSKINTHGGSSVGVSGKENGLLKVKKIKLLRKGIDLGRVGEIVRVNTKFIILTDVPGIKGEDNKLISSLSKKSANLLIRKGIIAKGMVPKVQCLIDALTEGVNKTHIIDGRIAHAAILEIFTDSGIGTEILL